MADSEEDIHRDRTFRLVVVATFILAIVAYLSFVLVENQDKKRLAHWEAGNVDLDFKHACFRVAPCSCGDATSSRAWCSRDGVVPTPLCQTYLDAETPRGLLAENLLTRRNFNYMNFVKLRLHEYMNVTKFRSELGALISTKTAQWRFRSHEVFKFALTTFESGDFQEQLRSALEFAAGGDVWRVTFESSPVEDFISDVTVVGKLA
jgi:hypothetical protein